MNGKDEGSPIPHNLADHQRPSPYFAGWDRRGWKVYNLQFIINSLLFRVNSLQLISREFDDKLQISFDFLGGFVEKA